MAGLSDEVNRDGGGERSAERLPSVHLAHRDLARRQQRPEQDGCGFGRKQHGLGLDAAFELLLYPGILRQKLIASSLMV